MRTSTLALLLSAALTTYGLSPVTAHGEVIVRMETNLGDIDIRLHDPGFAIQGGGYGLSNGFYRRVIADPPIVNEFDPARSNV